MNILDTMTRKKHIFSNISKVVKDSGILNNSHEEKQLINEIRHNPDDESPYFKLASFYEKKDEKSKAAETYTFCANLLLKQKNYQTATFAIRKSIDLEPNNGCHHLLMGDLNMAYQQYDRARLSYLTSEHFHREKNDIQGIINALKKLITYFPDEAVYKVRLGNIYLSEKRYEEAQSVLLLAYSSFKYQEDLTSESYKRTLRLLFLITRDNYLTEGADIFGRDLVSYYVAHEEYYYACQLLEQMTKYEPESLDILETYAEILHKTDYHSRHIDVLEKIAEIYDKKGDRKYRDKIYEKILSYESDDLE